MRVVSNFTRNTVASQLSERSGLSVEQSKGVLDHVLTIMTEALGNGDKVEFRGFGIFDVYTRKPRVGRNPKNPQAGQYQIPAKRVVRFRAGKQITDKLNP